MTVYWVFNCSQRLYPTHKHIEEQIVMSVILSETLSVTPTYCSRANRSKCNLISQLFCMKAATMIILEEIKYRNNKFQFCKILGRLPIFLIFEKAPCNHIFLKSEEQWLLHATIGFLNIWIIIVVMIQEDFKT